MEANGSSLVSDSMSLLCCSPVCLLSLVLRGSLQLFLLEDIKDLPHKCWGRSLTIQKDTKDLNTSFPDVNKWWLLWEKKKKKSRHNPEMTEINIGLPDIFRYCQLTGQIVKDWKMTNITMTLFLAPSKKEKGGGREEREERRLCWQPQDS